MRPKFGKVEGVLLAFAAILLAIAAGIADSGFDKLAEMRQLERVPRTAVGAVTGGEVNLAGVARPGEQLLRSPDTATETLYYRYMVHQLERDSDGDESWRIVTDQIESVPFLLVDETGQITVVPGGRVAIDAPRKHSRRHGDLRYSEYRIDSGERMFVFGMAVDGAGSYEVRFDQPGRYTPIISKGGESQVRADMALGSLTSTWWALAFATAAIFFACLSLGIYQTAMFLLMISATASIGLLHWSWKAAELELTSAAEHYQSTNQRARNAVSASLKRHGIAWDGDWGSLGSLDNPVYAQLPVGERERLARIRLDLARSTERVRSTWTRVPERVVAWRTASHPPPSIPLPEPEHAQLAAMDADYKATALPRTKMLLVQAFGLAIAGWLGWHGFRRIRVKRLMENMPTSLSNGVAYGLTELTGEVVPLPGAEPLVSPIANANCVYFHYVVEEKRGSGNSWVTVEEKKRGQRFLVRDREGDFPVDPTGAEVISLARDYKSSDRRRYRESRIDIGESVYAFGRAAVDPTTGDSLYMAAGDEPFILSNLKEQNLWAIKAALGYLLLAGALMAILAAALAAIGAAGSFSGLSYLIAAMAGPLSLIAALGVLMYNDLVFLRHRIAATWANIDVSLQKRADLLPNLQELLKGYLNHERDLQDDLAALRSEVEHIRNMSQQQAAQFIEREQRLATRLWALVERHPELKASELMQQFQRTLVWLENEIALMRDGFNNAVERYNTRCGQFPELLLARTFGFAPAEQFQAPVEVRAVPEVVSDLLVGEEEAVQ